MSQPLTPIKASERLPVIDALRGIAVLGILLINVRASSFPIVFDHLFVLRLDWIAEKITYWGIEFLVHGKFFTMFTFLFGLGMAVQMSRAIDKGSVKKFPMIYVRRLLLLLIIGFLHDVFVWQGYVLLWYPIIGFLLLLLRNIKPRLMLILGIIFILLMSGVSLLQYTLSRPASLQEARETAPGQQSANTNDQKTWEKCNAIIRIYKEGSYIDIVKDRFEKIPSALMRSLYIGLYILGMYMLGVWTWRKGIFHDIKKHSKFIKKIFFYSLFIGVVSTAVFTHYRIWGSIIDSPAWTHFAVPVIRWTGYAALTVFYISGFLLLYRKAFFKRLVTPLEAVGRAAISNYIFQNIVASFVFYSYGLKLMGSTRPLVNLLICFSIFAIQIPLSVWWMKRFRFGPVEWLWRTLTYGKPQPLRNN